MTKTGISATIIDAMGSCNPSQPLSGTTYVVRAFGCQMNINDAERVRGMLEVAGSTPVEEPVDADFVIYLTCCVREAADTRLIGQVATMRTLPCHGPTGRRIIGIGGCIGQRDGDKLFGQLPHVDFVFGTHTLSDLPNLARRALQGETHLVSLREEDADKSCSADLPMKRDQVFHSWVPITYGCNNFCTYCIVPYVRGREKSRSFEDVITEIGGLVADGVKEVTLLGQNVNSYGRDLYGKPRFAELLRAVGETGVERIRFATSHPKDLSDDTIAAMAQTPAVMPYLHLPAQSGSSRILKLMHRTYDREQYLALVDRVREAMPDIALSTDIIVGFPGETEEDFLDTMSLVESVGYSQAFTFIYSKREGTPAAKIDDPTPREVIQDRFDRLVEVVQRNAFTANQPELGRTLPVLFDSLSKRDSMMLTGRSPKNQTVHVPVPEGVDPQAIIGSIRDVKIDEARTWYLKGSFAGK